MRLDRGSFDKKFDTKNISGVNYFKLQKNKNLIISTGTTSYLFMDEIMRNKAKVSVLNLNFLKPLNIDNLHKIIKNYENILIVEEHSESLGLYSIILGNLDLNIIKKSKFYKFAIKQKNLFAYGKRDDLRKINSIDTKSIIKFLEKKC